jgi:hypothetical protein
MKACLSAKARRLAGCDSTNRVVLLGLVGGDNPLFTVLGTTDRLLDGSGLLLLSRGSAGLLSYQIARGLISSSSPELIEKPR